jgi:hypothetical protein
LTTTPLSNAFKASDMPPDDAFKKFKDLRYNTA